MLKQRILRFNKIKSNDSLKFQVLKKLKLIEANNDLLTRRLLNVIMFMPHNLCSFG
jgi:hypothetical protein